MSTILKLKKPKPTVPQTAAQVPDLWALAGDDFQVEHEHRSYVRDDDDPYELIIPCERRGSHIYPHGPGMLAYASETPNGQRVKDVIALEGAVIMQHGSDGMNIAVPVERKDQLFAIVKPRRKRHLSPERREALIKAGEVYRWEPGSQGLAKQKP